MALLANLAFLGDDLTSSGFDLAQGAPLVDRAEALVHKLQAAVLDGDRRRVIASSSRYSVPLLASLARPALDAKLLPVHARIADIQNLREGLAGMTTTWRSPGGADHRLLTGRIHVPAHGARPAGTIPADLVIDTASTSEVRLRDRRNVMIGLAVAALLASALGIRIARHIVVSARRLGAAASRIGAQALDERLPVDEPPIQLVESTLAFNRMLDCLHNAFQRLSAFSSDLTHNLRAPVGNLLGEAQVASRARAAPKNIGLSSNRPSRSTSGCRRMIANMLFLAQVDNYRAAMSIDWIDLEAALDRVIGYFELLAEERGIRLRKTLPGSSGIRYCLRADETMLIGAVSNLVSNALRHATAASCIELAVIDSDGSSTIEVSNEGASTDLEQQTRIFARFYRADASRHGPSSGSGLGLAIVRSSMELHGGTAWVRSNPRRCSDFASRQPIQRRATGASLSSVRRPPERP